MSHACRLCCVQVMRGLLPEYGGHEVRTDGDSFTLAFHDAIDAVEYCLKVSPGAVTGGD